MQYQRKHGPTTSVSTLVQKKIQGNLKKVIIPYMTAHKNMMDDHDHDHKNMIKIMIADPVVS